MTFSLEMCYASVRFRIVPFSGCSPPYPTQK